MQPVELAGHRLEPSGQVHHDTLSCRFGIEPEAVRELQAVRLDPLCLLQAPSVALEAMRGNQ